jgi:hypothetical protein
MVMNLAAERRLFAVPCRFTFSLQKQSLLSVNSPVFIEANERGKGEVRHSATSALCSRFSCGIYTTAYKKLAGWLEFEYSPLAVKMFKKSKVDRCVRVCARARLHTSGRSIVDVYCGLCPPAEVKRASVAKVGNKWIPYLYCPDIPSWHGKKKVVFLIGCYAC